MPARVHALLVGIDQYPDPAHRLDGCIHDVEAFADILTGRVAPEALRLDTLLDGDATRDAVIARFRSHLGQAEPGDTVLFFYAGHGSRERAPEAFWTAEPDRLDETLVLWDSRQPGGWDLADKELAVLIQELDAKSAHVVVILDCCHSGSGTRALIERPEKVRRFPTDARIRPIESFIEGVQANAERIIETGWDLGTKGRHILLAACRDDQEASEYSAAGRKVGAFTHFLVDVLKEAPAAVTYRDLGAAAAARVSRAVFDQTPQIEATDDNDLNRAFLSGALLPRVASYVVSEKDGAWWIDGGRINGVMAPAKDDATRVAIFAATASAADMADAAGAVALADVVMVEAARSRLNVTQGDLKAGSTYKAVVSGVPLPMTRIRLTGDAAALADLRAELVGNVDLTESSDGNADVAYVIDCKKGDYRISNAADGRVLAAPASTAGESVEQAEQIAQWQRYVALDNPTSTIGDHEFSVDLFAGEDDEDAPLGADARLTAKRTKDGLDPPIFRLRVKNKGSRDLYVGILALDELFGCSTNLFAEGVKKIAPGSDPAWALGGEALKSEIPQALRDEGRTVARDILKVIVSTGDFNIRRAALGSLGAPRTRNITDPGSTLERVLGRVQARVISAASKKDKIQDFRCWTGIVTTTEPSEGVELSAAKAADVGVGVTIDAHPSLEASARLTTIQETRADVGSVLPPLFRGNDGAGETLQFTASRGSSPGLSVLELNGIKNHEAVTPESPLVVRLPVALDANELVIPVAYDGEDYLVLGQSTPDGASTTMTLSRLPHPMLTRKRSLFGSIKILFQKFTAPIFGKPFEYPLLATAAWDEAGAVTYVKDAAAIADLVKQAKRVVVFVHGIIGDTTAMGAKLPVREGDLYLAFDYENLHTTIEKNAEGLRARLAAVGLTPGTGKDVVLVAHSMGGLVSRWYVEKLDGAKTVSHLILAGTPNAGSNWSTVEDWLTASFSLSINNLTSLTWPAAVTGALFMAVEKIDVSLDQMKPGSAFLTELNTPGTDPGIPYTIVAGNTSLAGSADGGRVRRLLKKVLHHTTSVAFLFQPNDIAVAVTSSESVAGARQPAPVKHQVACDHISYFNSEAGVNMLLSLLK